MFAGAPASLEKSRDARELQPAAPKVDADPEIDDYSCEALQNKLLKSNNL